MKKLLILLIFALMSAVSASAITYSADDEALIAKAMKLMDAGSPTKAIQILDSLTKVYPGDVALNYELAYAYWLCKDIEGCVEILEPIYRAENKDITEDDSYLHVYSLLGSGYYRLGEVDKSNAVFADAISLWPDQGLLYFNLGVNQLAVEDSKAALETFERGIKNSPAWKSNYRGALNVLLKQGATSKCICYITSLVLLDPYSEVTVEYVSIIPKLLGNTVKKKEDGNGYDITVNIDSDSSASDLMMALMAAASTLDKKENEVRENQLEKNVESLGSILLLDEILDVPLIGYLKAMKEADPEMPNAFWHWLLSRDFPMEYQDWSDAHNAELRALNLWMNENPFPLK